jgi:hypothetical protein
VRPERDVTVTPVRVLVVPAVLAVRVRLAAVPVARGPACPTAARGPVVPVARGLAVPGRAR